MEPNVPSLSSFFTDALAPAYPHAEARRLMLARRHSPLPPHNPADARRLWYALLLFLYPDEEAASDEVWVHARSVVLGLLRRDLGGETARAYLAAFGPWALGERAAWVREVAGTLYNLDQIGEATARAGHPAALAEWAPLHTTLRARILAAMRRAGMHDEVLGAVRDIGAARDRGVADHLRRAYWDLLAADLEAGHHERVMAQIQEVRRQLCDIVPAARHAAELDPWLDPEFIAQGLAHGRAGDDLHGSSAWLRELEKGALRVLREYDSEHLRPRYDELLAQTDGGDGNQQRPRAAAPSVISVLRNVTVLADSLYQRTRAWKHILRADS